MHFPSSLIWMPAAGILTLAPAALPGQTTLHGVVRESSSLGKPLAGVEVVLLGYALRTTSDAAGRFVLGPTPDGYQVVLFRSVGYQPAWLRFTTARRDSTNVEVFLVPVEAQQLEPIDVAGRAPAGRFDGFEERRRRGLGVLIDSTTIRQSDHLSLTSLLRRHTRINIATVYLPGERTSQEWAVSRRSSQRCPLHVILDGVAIYRADMPGRNPPDLRQFSVSTLEAVEVYSSPAETPSEFADNGNCGTLVLWTRRA